MVVDAMFRATIARCGRLLPQPIVGELGAMHTDRIIGESI